MVQFSIGRTTKLGVQAAWAHLFLLNETAKKKETDGQLAAWMLKEFPSRKSKLFKDLAKGELWRVQQARARYNRGAFTQGKVPEVKSHRYDSKGKRCDPKFSGKAGVKAEHLLKAK